MAPVCESFRRLAEGADLVIVEGAGSPAEINLREGDIANMGFAAAMDLPVLLVGDIDRGGVIAQIVGTQAVLPAADRGRIAGFVINKFRGDPALFEAGLAAITAHTGWPSLGVVPWFAAAARLPAEDVLDLRSAGAGGFVVAVPRLSRLANFDDLDPLAAEPGLRIEIVEPGRPLPAEARLVLLAGSKSTLADLAFFRAQGWDIDLAAHLRRGGHVLGLCGGYQMLGREIEDADGLEGPPGRAAGLGHLEVTTRMQPQKRLAQVRARLVPGGPDLDAYEIHLGRTAGPDCARFWLEVDEAGVWRPEGAASADGRVRGCYLHGLFAADAARAAMLRALGADPGGIAYEQGVEAALDALADHLAAHLDVARLASLARDIG
jgi:adenosylcobyric acid synthase